LVCGQSCLNSSSLEEALVRLRWRALSRAVSDCAMAAATGHMIITTLNKRIHVCQDMSMTAVVVPATAAELTASPTVR